MGRHTVPGTGTPEPDQGFWVRLAVGALVVLAVVAFVVLRGGGGGGDDQASTSASTATTPTGAASASTPATTGATTPASTTPARTPSPTATTRPPTLTFTVRYPAYITVRIPGGRTLVSKLFPAGAKATFDQKLLQVVNGRPQAVRFVVNGTPRKPGPAGQTEVFTVRRR